MCLQWLKGIRTRYVTGVPFVNRSNTKEVPFLSKMVYKILKGLRIRSQSGASPFKSLLSTRRGFSYFLFLFFLDYGMWLKRTFLQCSVYVYYLGGEKIPLILRGDSNHALLKTFFDVNGISSLFQYFADVRILDRKGRSALWHAKNAGSKECADILRHNGCHDLGTMIPQVSRNDVFL